MSTTATVEVDAILDRVRSWPSPTRIALARRILETLEAPATPDPASPARAPRGASSARAAGLPRADRPAPSGEESRRIIEGELREKSGP